MSPVSALPTTPPTPATELAGAIRRGERSAVEALEEHLTRIDAAEVDVHAFNLVLADRARSAARTIDERMK